MPNRYSASIRCTADQFRPGDLLGTHEGHAAGRVILSESDGTLDGWHVQWESFRDGELNDWYGHRKVHDKRMIDLWNYVIQEEEELLW